MLCSRVFDIVCAGENEEIVSQRPSKEIRTSRVLVTIDDKLFELFDHVRDKIDVDKVRSELLKKLDRIEQELKILMKTLRSIEERLIREYEISEYELEQIEEPVDIVVG